MKRLYKITVSLLLIVTSLVYKPNLVIADDGTPGEITIDKTKDLGNNDIYEITLSVQGNPIETTTPAPVDIVLVLDRSGSMRGSRMTALKTAAKNFINTILDRNSDSRIAIVSFAEFISRDTSDFISHRATLIDEIDGLNANGGTHLEGGIREGYLMLEANTSSRPKSMVIMGDGEPTFGYDFNIEYDGPVSVSQGWNSCSVSVATNNRNNAANYTGRFDFNFSATRIGTGSNRTFSKTIQVSRTCDNERTGSTSWSRSFDLADSVAHIAGWVKDKYDVYSIGLEVNNAGKTVLESTQNKGYWAATSSNLNNIFNLIAQDVTNYFPAGTEAVVTDELGEHFTFEGFIPGYPGTADFDNATQIITWDFGEIKETTQVLKYKVKLKADAPANFLDTNEEAWLNYKDPDGNPGDREFPKPEVIAIRYEAKAGGSVSRALESMDETQGVAKGSTAIPDADFLFVKWTSDAAGNDSVSSNPNFTPAKVNGKNVPATYYAHFVRADDVTITYIANPGGSVDRPSETLAPVSGIAQGSTATPAPGYQFINWTSDAAGVLAVGSALLFVPAKVGGVNVAATYYANFEPIDYTFTFDPNHGTEANVVETFQVGGSVTEANFSRIGFTFDGWTLDAAGNTPYTEGFTDLAPEDVYVYAQWKENADVTINYVANTGGNVSRGSETLAPATG
ncbi:MAG: VWA domain-containing protein, partial [Erysipelothrix sp.]|nr:VWA domain-containing protein [Erysipelothrix sp.]